MNDKVKAAEQTLDKAQRLASETYISTMQAIDSEYDTSDKTAELAYRKAKDDARRNYEQAPEYFL